MPPMDMPLASMDVTEAEYREVFGPLPDVPGSHPVEATITLSADGSFIRRVRIEAARADGSLDVFEGMFQFTPSADGYTLTYVGGED